MNKHRTGLAGLLLLGCVSAGLAGQAKVSFNALMDETQLASDEPDEMTIVWWIPEEFWQVNAETDPTITQADMESAIRVLKPYVVLFAVDGTLGPFGGARFKPEPAVRATIRLKDSRGATYPPVAPDQIDPDAKILLSAILPALGELLGPLGKNMNYFLFPAKDPQGRPIAVARKEGRFSVLLGKREYTWRLPLGSLLPRKTCPKCGGKLNGAYKFCPWDGTPLPEPKEPGDGGPK